MNVRRISRRAFLRASGGVSAAWVLGALIAPRAGADEVNFEPNLFVAFSPDGSVQITVSRSEMGQGVRTALPRIVADELEADLARVTLLQEDIRDCEPLAPCSRPAHTLRRPS